MLNTANLNKHNHVDAVALDSPQDMNPSSMLTRNGSRSSALGQAHSGGQLNTKPTLLRIGEASALPVLLCGLLQKEALMQQQQQQQPSQSEANHSLEESEALNAIDVENFEEEFFGLLNQRYAQMMISACLLQLFSVTSIETQYSPIKSPTNKQSS